MNINYKVEKKIRKYQLHKYLRSVIIQKEFVIIVRYTIVNGLTSEQKWQIHHFLHSNKL